MSTPNLMRLITSEYSPLCGSKNRVSATLSRGGVLKRGVAAFKSVLNGAWHHSRPLQNRILQLGCFPTLGVCR